MKEQRFTLQPFQSSEETFNISINGAIRRNVGKIDITCEIYGDIEAIVIQEKKESPMRMDELWKETCLEVFLAPGASDHYWEANLSPTGHWNVYRFAAYRKGMEEESAVSGLPISVQRNERVLTLSSKIDVDNLIYPEKSLRVGISAVIKSMKGLLSYWALVHPGPEPDFHSRKSFLIEI